MCKSNLHIVAALLTAATAGSALAAVSAEEAKQLGGPVITVFGAEKAGNKDGTIPPYTAEKVNFKFDPETPGNLSDPWGEKPFSITAQNYTQYVERLTEGQKALFKQYPNYRMDVYPTHRTHVFPKFGLDNTIKNATACKTISNGESLEGCYSGVPFPIPKNGHEVMWNHALKWEGMSYGGIFRSIFVNKDGKAFNQGENKVWITNTSWDPKKTGPMSASDIYFYLRFDTFAPARRVGEKTMFLDPIDPTKPGRRAYSYIPGQRRVKLAPDLAYDTPSPVTGGVTTMDESYVFFGAMDRYDFKLVGKKEKYILYNAFTLSDYKVCPEEVYIAVKGFPNPDCLRWELHRVWVVEATLKPGLRHVYHRRIFYFDEDNAGAGIGDNYDAAGKIYRVTANKCLPIPGANIGTICESSITVDLQTGAWADNGEMSIKGSSWVETKPQSPFFFSPEAMAAEGIR